MRISTGPGRFALVGLVGLLLLVDAAAIHDIAIGESDVWMEWTFLGLSVLFLVFLIRKAWTGPAAT